MNIGTDTCNVQFCHAYLQLLQKTKEAAESIMCVIVHRTKQNLDPKDDASETIETGQEYVLYLYRAHHLTISRPPFEKIQQC
jgi:hypothetical protein